MQVHVPLYDPSSVMLLAVCSAQPKVHKARVLTRAVRSVLAQVCTCTSALLSFVVPSFCSHANALYMVTEKAVRQLHSLQLNTSRCTLLLLLSGQLQIPMCRHTHLAILPTVMFQCCTISLHMSARRTHMVLVPILGVAEETWSSVTHTFGSGEAVHKVRCRRMLCWASCAYVCPRCSPGLK